MHTQMCPGGCHEEVKLNKYVCISVEHMSLVKDVHSFLLRSSLASACFRRLHDRSDTYKKRPPTRQIWYT